MSEKGGIPRKMYIRVISDYKYRGQLGTHFGQVYLGIRDTLAFLSPCARVRALYAVWWPPRAFEDANEIAALPWRRPYMNQLTGQIIFEQV